MKVINPTENEITVRICGVDYTLPAKGELTGVPSEHAVHWRNRLHEFIKIEPEGNDENITLKSKKETPETDDNDDGNSEEKTVSLDDLKRADLDELAESKGLDSKSYSTVDKIKEAIKKVTNK